MAAVPYPFFCVVLLVGFHSFLTTCWQVCPVPETEHAHYGPPGTVVETSGRLPREVHEDEETQEVAEVW